MEDDEMSYEDWDDFLDNIVEEWFGDHKDKENERGIDVRLDLVWGQGEEEEE